MLKRLLAALAIAVALFGAGRLPDIDALLQRVPTAVQAATT